MKRYFIVSAFVVIVLTINLSWGKQHGRRQQQKHIDIKYVHLLEAKHSRHHHGHKKELGKVTHLSQSKPTGKRSSKVAVYHHPVIFIFLCHINVVIYFDSTLEMAVPVSLMFGVF